MDYFKGISAYSVGYYTMAFYMVVLFCSALAENMPIIITCFMFMPFAALWVFICAIGDNGSEHDYSA